MSEREHPERGRVLGYLDTKFEEVAKDFYDPRFEGRRLFSEFLGTFFLVLVARVAPSSTRRAVGRSRLVSAPAILGEGPGDERAGLGDLRSGHRSSEGSGHACD